MCVYVYVYVYVHVHMCMYVCMYVCMSEMFIPHNVWLDDLACA
jgi:hypothetical protein